MKDDVYINRIIQYCEKINRYMDKVTSYNDFISMSEKVDAVILNLEQIGETGKKLSEDTKNRYTNIQWIKVIGLRNIISHQYEGIRLEIIYEIALAQIPKLLKSLTIDFVEE